MMILAPMHPVMLVYALDETEGKDLPKELTSFATYQGQWKPDWLKLAVQNAAVRDRIRVDFKILSSTNAGFATLAHSTGEWKMRIAIHSQAEFWARVFFLGITLRSEQDKSFVPG